MNIKIKCYNLHCPCIYFFNLSQYVSGIQRTDILFTSFVYSVSLLYFVGKNKIEASCNSFEVRDPTGKSRFKVTEKGVLYGTDEVTYSGKTLSSSP